MSGQADLERKLGRSTQKERPGVSGQSQQKQARVLTPLPWMPLSCAQACVYLQMAGGKLKNDSGLLKEVKPRVNSQKTVAGTAQR